jgi:hypothetical protein
MTAPPREGPARIRPTLGPPGSRAADRLLKASMFPLILGVCGGMLEMLHHHTAAAITAAAVGTGAAAVLAAAAGYLAARAMKFNPWPAAMGIIAAAGLAGTAVLPRAGLAGLQIPLVLGAAAGLALTGWLALRYHRRRLVYHRWAQALVGPLSQSTHQKEQVLAGLAKTARQERVWAPHYGAAPNAAWYLRPVRWSGCILRVAVLSLPAHDDITTQEFKDSISGALTRRKIVEYLRLDVDPSRDEITMTALDGPEVVEEEEPDRQTQAIESAKTAAEDFLKGVKVKILDWVEGDSAEPEDAGPAWPIQRMEITFDHNVKLTSLRNRLDFVTHLGEQLYGDPAILRARWNLPQGHVLVHKRATFPALVPHRPVDTAALFGKVVVVVYGYDEDGNLAFIQLSHTDAPHFLITGGTGTGKSVLLRIIAIDAARQGMEVRGCDPKRIEMKGLRGWPGVTRIATRVKEMIALIEDTYTEMHARYAAIEEDRAREEDYQRILLIIDEFLMLSMLINDYWAEERVRLGGQQPKEHPVMRQLRGLVVMARGGVMNLILATQRGDADIFPDGVRDSIGGRVALGRQTQESAKMMFGDVNVGRDIPQQSQGVGTTLTVDGPVRVKVEWLPDPARYPDNFKPEDGDPQFQRDLLLAMLPPGSTWDGPQPYQPSEPDSAPAGALAGGRTEVRLLFFARFAMQWYHEAHLTDGDTGGMPAGPETPASYGWRPGPGGELQPCGKWIGCMAGPPEDRRVFLHPASVLEVASRLAGELGGPPFERAAVDTALLQAGLLRYDTEKDGRRWVVLRPVPGNDLPGKDRRQRVWDIPANELLGNPAELAEPAARPAASSRALLPGPEKLARDLAEGDRIILVFEDGQVLEAVVYSTEEDTTAATAPEPDGSDRLVINYQAVDGDPGSVRARTDYPIRLAAGGDGSATGEITKPGP